MMVAFLLWTTVSEASPAGGVPSLFVLEKGLEKVLCSVTLTMVAFLCTVTRPEFGSMGGERGSAGRVSEPGRLADLLTLLEEMVMEEKPALF